MNVMQPHLTEVDMTMRAIAYPCVTTYILKDVDKDIIKDILHSKAVRTKLNATNLSNLKTVVRFHSIDEDAVEFDSEESKFFNSITKDILEMYAKAYEGNIPSQEYILEMFALLLRNPMFNIRLDELGIDFNIEEDCYYKFDRAVETTILGAITMNYIIESDNDDEDENTDIVAMTLSYFIDIDDEIYVVTLNFNRCLVVDKEFVTFDPNEKFHKFIELNETVFNNTLNHMYNVYDQNNADQNKFPQKLMTLYSSIFNRDNISKTYQILSMLNTIGIEIGENNNLYYRALKPLNAFTLTDIKQIIPFNLAILDNSTLASIIDNNAVFEDEDDLELICDEIESFGNDGSLEIAIMYECFIEGSKEEEDFLNYDINNYVDSLIGQTYGFSLGKHPSSLEHMVEEHLNVITSHVGDIRNLEDRIYIPEEFITNPIVSLPHVSVDIQRMPIWYFLVVIPAVLDMHNNNTLSEYIDSTEEELPEFLESQSFNKAIKYLQSHITKVFN